MLNFQSPFLRKQTFTAGQASLPAALLLTLALAACGGGGGDSASTAQAAGQAEATALPATGVQPSAQAEAESPLPADGAAAGTSGSHYAQALSAHAESSSASAFALETAQSGRAPMTFHVDSRAGSDSNDGSASTRGSAGVGPWLTLGKLRGVAFVPGDTVLLNCGAVWNEVLELPTSGTQAAPITVRSHPATCPTGVAMPRIDGFVRVPNPAWTRHAANVYKVGLPLQLLAHSTFETGVGAWRWTSTAGNAVLSAPAACGADGSPCLQLVSGSNTAGKSLAYSATFPVDAGAAYTIRFAMKAPAGVNVRVFVRRGAAPWEVVGTVVSHTGTGAWQQASASFQGVSQLDNARVDIDVPGGSHLVQIDNLHVERAIAAPFAATLGTTTLRTSHHPNRGHEATTPTSLYARAAADADSVTTAGGGRGSTYVPLGTDLRLPAGVSLRNGTRIRIRTNAWIIDERRVTSVSGGRISIDTPTSYPLRSGWGYYLVNEAWMLDSPDEWFHDAAAASVLVRTSTDFAPAAPLALTSLATCVNVASRQYVAIEGLELRGCGIGVKATSSVGVTLSRMRIGDIATDAVLAGGSRALKLSNNIIERAGTHAVLGREDGLSIATDMRVESNTIVDTAVVRSGGVVVSLPVQSLGAVLPGERALVSANTVSGSGYLGIRTNGTSTISANRVDNACLVLDDCGGIYVFGNSQGTRIEGNFVQDVPGGMDGKPAGTTSQAQGVFLDDHAHGVTVTRNVVSGAEAGIFLHNAYDNVISSNVLYGNRKHQLWSLEDARVVHPDGDLYNNTVTDNLMFSTGGGAAVGHDSVILRTTRFGNYDRNRYSALIASRIVSEAWPTGSNSFDFAAWQQARATDGSLRNQDRSGSVVNAVGYANVRVLGNNIVPASVSAGPGWTPWNDTAPLAVASVSDCGAAPCVQVTAGASTSLVATPPFSTTAEAWYRVSFDLAANVANMPVSVMVRRGGGGTNGYESLMGSAEMVNATTTLRRYSFLFKATKSIRAADPATGDIGARLYFDRLLPASRLSLRNVEIVQVTAADAALVTHLVSNPGAAAQFACPATGANAARCNQFVDFATGTPVAWPVLIPAGGAIVVYSRDATLVDTDGDGISDSQDACPGTPAGSVTNARGCGITQ